MAETTIVEEAVEQTAQAEPETLDTPESVEMPAPRKERNILIPFLTVLLILLGVGEAVFWGYFGFSSFRSSLAAERYEEQQRALEEERASKGIVGGSSYGPYRKVENGRVTWEREEDLPIGDALTQESSVVRREDGLRLSRLSVANIPYELAEMAVEDVLPPDADKGAAPTNT